MGPGEAQQKCNSYLRNHESVAQSLKSLSPFRLLAVVNFHSSSTFLPLRTNLGVHIEPPLELDSTTVDAILQAPRATAIAPPHFLSSGAVLHLPLAHAASAASLGIHTAAMVPPTQSLNLDVEAISGICG